MLLEEGRVVIEVINAENLRLLKEDCDTTEDCFLYSGYASGDFAMADMLEPLLAQAFYNPWLPSILEVLVRSTGGMSGLMQMPIPPDLIGVHFSAAYLHLLLQKQLLCIGLYRAAGVNSSVKPYVVTNPPRSTTLLATDRLFVIQPTI